MTMTNKRFRLGVAVATATLSAASVFALAAPASAGLPELGPPREVQVELAATTTTAIKVNWKKPDVGTELSNLNGFRVSFNGPGVAVFPATEDPDEVIVNVPAVLGQVDYTATGTGLNPFTLYTITVTANVPGFQTSAAPVFETTKAVPIVLPSPKPAYYPFNSWGALVKQNYRDFLGREPRLDEYVFWTQKLQNSPQAPIYATGVDYRLLNPNGTPSVYNLTGVRDADFPYGRYRANNGAPNPAAPCNVGNNFCSAVGTNPIVKTDPEPLTSSAVQTVYVTETGAVRGLIGNAAVPFAPTLIGFTAKVRGDFLVFLYEEARQTYGPTVRLYNAFFPERLGDYGGIEFWRKRLASGKWSLEQISNFFTTSSEFKRTYETLPDGTIRPLDDAEFVALVYVNVLKRPADGPGVAFWTRQLSEGKRTRGGIMTGFSESQEYRRLTSHEVQTTVLVNSLRRSAPTENDIVRSKQIGEFGLGSVPTPSRLALLLDALTFLPVEEPTATAQYPFPANNQSFAFTHQVLVNEAAYQARITK